MMDQALTDAYDTKWFILSRSAPIILFLDQSTTRRPPIISEHPRGGRGVVSISVVHTNTHKHTHTYARIQTGLITAADLAQAPLALTVTSGLGQDRTKHSFMVMSSSRREHQSKSARSIINLCVYHTTHRHHVHHITSTSSHRYTLVCKLELETGAGPKRVGLLPWLSVQLGELVFEDLTPFFSASVLH